MRPSKRTSSVLNPGDMTDHHDLPEEADTVTNPDDALTAADEAEAEADEAEAQAAAARARARAIRLRRQAEMASAAEAAATASTDAESSATEPGEPVVATDADLEAAEEYPDEPSDSPKRWRRRPGLLRRVLKLTAAALVIVVSAGLLGLSGWMYSQHRNADALRQQTAEFTAAARQGAVTLMSLDFNHAKEDVQRIIDSTTGDFKKDFEGQAEDFVKVAQSSKVVTQATVTAVGIQKMTKDTATALVAVTTRVSNMASDKQDPRAWRLTVELQRDGDQIKLAKVEFQP